MRLWTSDFGHVVRVRQRGGASPDPLQSATQCGAHQWSTGGVDTLTSSGTATTTSLKLPVTARDERSEMSARECVAVASSSACIGVTSAYARTTAGITTRADDTDTSVDSTASRSRSFCLVLYMVLLPFNGIIVLYSTIEGTHL